MNAAGESLCPSGLLRAAGPLALARVPTAGTTDSSCVAGTSLAPDGGWLKSRAPGRPFGSCQETGAVLLSWLRAALDRAQTQTSHQEKTSRRLLAY